jgi:hypothetical protein
MQTRRVERNAEMQSDDLRGKTTIQEDQRKSVKIQREVRNETMNTCMLFSDVSNVLIDITVRDEVKKKSISRVHEC